MRNLAGCEHKGQTSPNLEPARWRRNICEGKRAASLRCAAGVRGQRCDTCADRSRSSRARPCMLCYLCVSQDGLRTEAFGLVRSKCRDSGPKTSDLRPKTCRCQTGSGPAEGRLGECDFLPGPCFYLTFVFGKLGCAFGKLGQRRQHRHGKDSSCMINDNGAIRRRSMGGERWW